MKNRIDTKFGFLTLDQLLQLRPKSFNEAEGAGLFREALGFFRGRFDEYEKTAEAWEDAVQYACDDFTEDFLRPRCPPIKFIGRGVGRLAFACEDGRICKFATGRTGVSQNSNEIQTLLGYPDSACFMRMFDYDESRDRLGLEVEACAVVGDDLSMAVGIIEKLGLKTIPGETAAELVSGAYNVCRHFAMAGLDADYGRFSAIRQDTVKPFVENVLAGKSAQAKTFRSLVEYFQAEWKKRSVGLVDLHAGNVGYAYRHGEICLVIIDAGI